MLVLWQVVTVENRLDHTMGHADTVAQQIVQLQLKLGQLESLVPAPHEISGLRQAAVQLEEVKLRIIELPEIKRKACRRPSLVSFRCLS